MLNKFNAYIVYSEVIKEYWTVPLTSIKYCIEQGKNLLLVDKYKELNNFIPLFALEDYDELDDEDYTLLRIPTYKEEQLTFSTFDKQLMLKFHYTWLNILWDYLHSPNFYQLLNFLNKERETNVLFPEKENIFNCFSIDFNSIRTVWIDKNSYTNNLNNGYLYSTYNNKGSKFLEFLQKEIRILFNKPDLWMLRYDLIHLINQGVFLYPKCLCISEKNIYESLWQPLFDLVINALEKKENVIFVVFDESIKFTTKHTVIQKTSSNEYKDIFSILSNLITINF